MLHGRVDAGADARPVSAGAGFFMPGYEQYTPARRPLVRSTIVHGWNDDIVPVENSIRYARQYKCALHILDSDHRLTPTSTISAICSIVSCSECCASA